jgi:hypothetical protein
MRPRAYARSRSDVRRGGKADDASIKPMMELRPTSAVEGL